MTPSQIQFIDSGDAKITLEADGASTLLIKGDDGSEIGYLKNVTFIRNHTTTSSSPYSLPITVDRVGIQNTSETNPFYVDLPATTAALAGRTFRLKDETGNAGSFPIHIRANGSDVIDGASPYILNTDYNAVTLYCDGSNWFIE